MAAAEACDDWLQTPGIAYRSMKTMASWSEDKRMRGSVMLGWRGTEREQKMKENHDRHMGNLRDRYMELKREKEGKQEEKRGNLPGLPSFGTQASFCDKSGNRVGTPSPAPTRAHTPVAALQPLQSLQLYQLASPSIPNVAKTNGSVPFSANNENQQLQQLSIPSVPATTDSSKPGQEFGEEKKVQQPHFLEKPSVVLNVVKPDAKKSFQGFGGVDLQHEQRWRKSSSYTGLAANISKKDLPLKVYWEQYPDTNNNINQTSVQKEESKTIEAKSEGETATCQSSSKSHCSNNSFNCSTPNEDNLCFSDADASIPESPPKKKSSAEEEKEEEMEVGLKSRRVAFTIVPEAGVKGGCQNQVLKERVRNYDKEPTAAGKRYVSDMDKLENNVQNRLQTSVRFDKRRVKKWINRFQTFSPVSLPKMDVYRRVRRHSDPIHAAVFDAEGVLIEEKKEEPPMDEEMKRADEVFGQMLEWVGQELEVEWSLEDAGRIQFPPIDSLVEVRVTGVAGRRALVAPFAAFDVVANDAKDIVRGERPPSLSRLNERAMVLVEVECDIIDEYDYRRGWAFDGNNELIAVLLMDERKIVHVPRSKLWKCPPSLLSKPPLCVAVQFDREVMAHELPLLVDVGCKLDCRVMGEEEGGGGEGLKLSLVKIDIEGRNVGPMFCGEVCAGACQYHRNSHHRDKK